MLCANDGAILKGPPTSARNPTALKTRDRDTCPPKESLSETTAPTRGAVRTTPSEQGSPEVYHPRIKGPLKAFPLSFCTMWRLNTEQGRPPRASNMLPGKSQKGCPVRRLYRAAAVLAFSLAGLAAPAGAAPNPPAVAQASATQGTLAGRVTNSRGDGRRVRGRTSGRRESRKRERQNGRGSIESAHGTSFLGFAWPHIGSARRAALLGVKSPHCAERQRERL